MITYESPEQVSVNIGDHIEGIRKKELQAENEELRRAAHNLLLAALLLCATTQCEECKCVGPSTKTCALAQIIERLEELGVRV